MKNIKKINIYLLLGLTVSLFNSPLFSMELGEEDLIVMIENKNKKISPLTSGKIKSEIKKRLKEGADGINEVQLRELINLALKVKPMTDQRNRMTQKKWAMLDRDMQKMFDIYLGILIYRLFQL